MANFRFLGPFWYFYHLRKSDTNFRLKTSNNRRLGTGGDNDRKSKRFCSNAVLCESFTWQIVKTLVFRLQGEEGPKARDQTAFCAFHSFLAYMRRMRNNNLEIRIAGSSCRPELVTRSNLHVRTPLVSDPQPFKIPIFFQSNPESESNPRLRKQPFLLAPAVFAGYQERGAISFVFMCLSVTDSSPPV